MKEAMDYFSANPTALLIAIVVCFAVLYFVYRKLASALIVLVVVFLLTLLCYSYYRDTSSLDEALTKTKVESQEFIERFSGIFHGADKEVKDIKEKIGK